MKKIFLLGILGCLFAFQQAFAQTDSISDTHELKNVLENRMQKLEMEYQALPEDTDLRAAWKMLVQEQHRYEIKKTECSEVEENWKKLSEQIQEKKKKAMEIAQQLYLQCSYAVFRDAEEAAADYEKNLIAFQPDPGLLMKAMSIPH